MSTTASLELTQDKSFALIKGMNLFGLCHFEWMSSKPIDHVIPKGHTPLDRAPACEHSDDPSCGNEVRHMYKHYNNRKCRVLVVGFLHPFPVATLPTLIVVNRKRQFPSRLH